MYSVCLIYGDSLCTGAPYVQCSLCIALPMCSASLCTVLPMYSAPYVQCIALRMCSASLCTALPIYGAPYVSGPALTMAALCRLYSVLPALTMLALCQLHSVAARGHDQLGSLCRFAIEADGATPLSPSRPSSFSGAAAFVTALRDRRRSRR